MTAKNDDARLRLFQENKSVDALLAILKYYLERDIKIRSREKESKQEGGSKGNDYDDVLIYLVTVQHTGDLMLVLVLPSH